MKNYLVVFLAAAFGAVVGSLATKSLGTSKASGVVKANTVETRELLILNENDRPATRLVAESGGAVLRFYAGDLRPALEVGVEENPPFRFVRLFAEGGQIVSALTSAPPDGQTRLVLGDARWPERIIMGPIEHSDMPAVAPVDLWGLEFHKPASLDTLFSILANSKDPAHTTVGLQLMRSNGKVWSVY